MRTPQVWDPPALTCLQSELPASGTSDPAACAPTVDADNDTTDNDTTNNDNDKVAHRDRFLFMRGNSCTSSCARKTTGRFFCRGDDDNGQLGDGAALADQPIPMEVVGA